VLTISTAPLRTKASAISKPCSPWSGCDKYKLSISTAQALGVDIDNLYLSQPDHGEQGLEIAEAFVRSGAVGVSPISPSISALGVNAATESTTTISTAPLRTKASAISKPSQALRKLSGAISKSNTTAIFINQIREKVGVMFGN
jgi:recombination protein RecA